MAKKRKTISWEELIKQADAQNAPSKKEQYEDKYSKSISKAKASEMEQEQINKLKIRTGKYSLRTKILNSKWVKTGRPSTEALKWLFGTVFKNPRDYRYNSMLLKQGGLFIFEYTNPKYKNTSVLPYFDQYPLVLSLGPISTNEGVRNLGFNLHLLPPKIRIIVLAQVFDIYKKLYRYNIFYKKDRPVNVKYKQIIKVLDKYGVRFCVRLYIPRRMKQIATFDVKDWHKAIFISSRGYYGIKAKQLQNEWRKFNRENGYNNNVNINWKTII